MPSYDLSFSPPMPSIHGRVSVSMSGPASNRVAFLFDTGADITLLQKDLLLQLVNGRNISYTNIQISGYLNFFPKREKGYFLFIKLDGCKPIRTLVAPTDSNENILGRPIINNLISQLNGPRQRLVINVQAKKKRFENSSK